MKLTICYSSPLKKFIVKMSRGTVVATGMHVVCVVILNTVHDRKRQTVVILFVFDKEKNNMYVGSGANKSGFSC